jgi:2-polyprenyl-3-methyl-5-hydroxy-6-metoxy-1,4-benzoquinol methylase
LTNACCVGQSTISASQKKVISLINSEITSKFYGCGSPIPDCLEGKTIVDLGCGTGVDVYIASYFAKESGKVIGIDMTESQLEVAKKHCKEMTDKYGFANPNV